jgi:hypothetical protein
MQSLLGFDSRINKHCIVVTVSEIEFAHELMEGGPIIEVWH